MNTVAEVELECSYGAGDGRTRSRVASMPKERSGRSRLDWRSDWEKMDMTTSICTLNPSVHSLQLFGSSGVCFAL